MARSIEKFDSINVAFCEDDVGGGLFHLHGHSQWDEAVNSVVDVEGLGGEEEMDAERSTATGNVFVELVEDYQLLSTAYYSISRSNS